MSFGETKPPQSRELYAVGRVANGGFLMQVDLPRSRSLPPFKFYQTLCVTYRIETLVLQYNTLG